MPKKRNKSSGSGGTNASPKRGHGYLKSGGSAFRDHSVPVNTKSRKVYSGKYS